MTPLGVTLVAVGGAAGTLARYGLVEAVKKLNPQPAGPPVFPAGTLVVNLIGCFAIGYLATSFSAGVREEYRAAVLVGVLGGFTTFSSFAWETQTLWAAGRTAAALSYIALSVAAGLALAYAGKRAAGG